MGSSSAPLSVTAVLNLRYYWFSAVQTKILFCHGILPSLFLYNVLMGNIKPSGSDHFRLFQFWHGVIDYKRQKLKVYNDV